MPAELKETINSQKHEFSLSFFVSHRKVIRSSYLNQQQQMYKIHRITFADVNY